VSHVRNVDLKVGVEAENPPRFWQRNTMTDDATLTELNTRMAAIRENIRELIEQAAAYSGAADQERTADRIADQEAQLAALLKKRDDLLGKQGQP
jgi:hypothetical protein